MPDGSEFKQVVRARMRITGEKYTTAMWAVVEAARTAIPSDTEDLGGRLSGLTGQTLAAFITEHLPDAIEGEHGASVLFLVAELCSHQARWRQERFPDSPRNRAAASQLMACARDITAMRPDDARVLAIGTAWAHGSSAGMMRHAEDVAVSRVSFMLTGDSLIDLLAATAARLLLNLDGI
jgi:hypothetical protein